MSWTTSKCEFCTTCSQGSGLYGLLVNNNCRMLEEFDREMDHTDSRMRSLTARVNKAIKKSGSKLTQILLGTT